MWRLRKIVTRLLCRIRGHRWEEIMEFRDANTGHHYVANWCRVCWRVQDEEVTP